MALRKTRRRRMTAKLKELRCALRRRMRAPIRKHPVRLNLVLQGHYAWCGITGSARSINRFRTEALGVWRCAPMHRGNRSRMYRPRFRARLLRFPIVPARIVHVRRYL